MCWSKCNPTKLVAEYYNKRIEICGLSTSSETYTFTVSLFPHSKLILRFRHFPAARVEGIHPRHVKRIGGAPLYSYRAKPAAAKVESRHRDIAHCFLSGDKLCEELRMRRSKAA